MVQFLQIEPTTRCNFTCGFCTGRHMAQRDLDFGLFTQVIDAHPDLRHIELQGEGEPLMHPRFFDMVEYVRLHRPGVRVSTITNGSLLNRRNIDGLLGTGIHKIYVSLESADPVHFRAIRGGSLERIGRGVAALLAERRRRRLARPTVGLAVTILRSTAGGMEAVVDLYRGTGMDGGISLQFLQGAPAYTGIYDATMAAELLPAAERRRFIREFKAVPRLVEAAQERSRDPGFYEALLDTAGGPPTCPWLEQGLYVAADGTACSCCFIKDNARFGLGRAGEVPADELADRQAGMLAALRSGRSPPACVGCPTANQVMRHYAEHAAQPVQ